MIQRTNYMRLQIKKIRLSETRKNTMMEMLFYLGFEKDKDFYSRRKEGKSSKWVIEKQ